MATPPTSCSGQNPWSHFGFISHTPYLSCQHILLAPWLKCIQNPTTSCHHHGYLLSLSYLYSQPGYCSSPHSCPASRLFSTQQPTSTSSDFSAHSSPVAYFIQTQSQGPFIDLHELGWSALLLLWLSLLFSPPSSAYPNYTGFLLSLKHARSFYLRVPLPGTLFVLDSSFLLNTLGSTQMSPDQGGPLWPLY